MCPPDCKSIHIAWVYNKMVYIALNEKSVSHQFKKAIILHIQYHPMQQSDALYMVLATNNMMEHVMQQQ